MFNNLTRLVVNECRLQFYEMRQYWVETVFCLLFFSRIFLALFLGIKIFIPRGRNTVSLEGIDDRLYNIYFLLRHIQCKTRNAWQLLTKGFS
ncbi:MAG: hypothetical protein ACI85S_002933 [Pseudohongiellaceae bacterium]|jgi:hypothetical protein